MFIIDYFKNKRLKRYLDNYEKQRELESLFSGLYGLKPVIILSDDKVMCLSGHITNHKDIFAQVLVSPKAMGKSNLVDVTFNLMVGDLRFNLDRSGTFEDTINEYMNIFKSQIHKLQLSFDDYPSAFFHKRHGYNYLKENDNG